MSSSIPPSPYFNNINFNPNFFSVVSAYLTEAIANTKYLKLLGGTLSGLLGIKINPRVELDVNGKCAITNSSFLPPANGQFGSAGTRLILNEGDVSNTPYALGTSANILWYGVPSIGSHYFYTGTTESLRITPSGNLGIGGDPTTFKLYANGTTSLNGNTSITGTLSTSSSLFAAGQFSYFGATDTSGLRIGKNDIFTNNTNAGGITIHTQNTGQQIQLGYFGGNGSILIINNANATITQPLLANGKVGVGTSAIPNNILQVGDGGKLRISNGTTDFTLIGTKDTNDANNTRIILNGYQKSGSVGNVEYVATTATGAHTFWLNNSTAVVDIDNTDFTVYKSISTIGDNYYTDGKYITYSSKTDAGGVFKVGYFITNEFFFNSLVNIAVSHNDTTYTYWHGYYGTNNSTYPMYITALNFSNMAFESFVEQTTLKSFIRVYPTVAYNTATQLRVKFYG